MMKFTLSKDFHLSAPRVGRGLDRKFKTIVRLGKGLVPRNIICFKNILYFLIFKNKAWHL